MEIISPISFIIGFLSEGRQKSLFQLVIAGAFLMHYVNRAIIYPSLNPSKSLSHLLVLLSAGCFNIANGSIQGKYLAETSINNISLVGCILFIAGFVGNVYHDRLLFRLKRESNGGYVIPKGALFDYVDYPNYFCEWIEWLGYVLLSQSNTLNDAPVVFLIALIATMSPRAYKGHLWYKKKFQEYPQSRKMVIPFVL